MTSLTKMILSPYLLASTTPSLRLLSIKTPPFLFEVIPVYQSLKLILYTSFAFCLFHLVFWTHKIFTRLLTAMSTNSLNLSVRDPTFQHEIHSSASKSYSNPFQSATHSMNGNCTLKYAFPITPIFSARQPDNQPRAFKTPLHINSHKWSPTKQALCGKQTQRLVSTCLRR